MENQADTRYISFTNLMLAVLRGWKALLAAALVFALLGGGLKGVSLWRTSGDAAQRARAAAEYESAMELYTCQKEELEANRQSVLDDIENQQAYLDESVLMNVDPYNVYEGTMYLYFSTDYQIMPDTVYQNVDSTQSVVLLYKAALEGGLVLDPVAEAVEMESKYLRELIGVKTEMAGGMVNPILSVTVRCGSAELAESILDHVEAQLQKVGSQITRSVGEHAVRIVMESVFCHGDQSLLDTQKSAWDRMEKLSEGLAAADEALNALKAPQAPSYTKKGMVLAAAKIGVLLGIVGFVCAAGVICVGFIAGDRVYSGREIEYRCGVKNLGSVALKSRKRKALDAWVWKRENRGEYRNTKVYGVLAARLQNRISEAGTVLVAGDAREETIAAVAEKLAAELPKMQVLSAGSLDRDPAAVRGLGKCDAVLLVVECGVSRYSAIDSQEETIREQGAVLMGCVAVDA